MVISDSLPVFEPTVGSLTNYFFRKVDSFDDPLSIDGFSSPTATDGVIAGDVPFEAGENKYVFLFPKNQRVTRARFDAGGTTTLRRLPSQNLLANYDGYRITATPVEDSSKLNIVGPLELLKFLRNGWQAPTTVDFKNRFSTDFVYDENRWAVYDSLILKSIEDAIEKFNLGIFSIDNYLRPLLYLSAHYLVVNLRESGQGESGIFAWATESIGGELGTSFTVPEQYKKPAFAFYITTPYGVRYIDTVYPYTVGNMFAIQGRSHY